MFFNNVETKKSQFYGGLIKRTYNIWVTDNGVYIYIIFYYGTFQLQIINTPTVEHRRSYHVFRKQILERFRIFSYDN